MFEFLAKVEFIQGKKHVFVNFLTAPELKTC